MTKTSVTMLALAMLATIWVESTGSEEKSMAKTTNPIVTMETSEGTIKIELWPARAPVTVKNFLQYADEGFYDGTIFHRVIDNFVIQGGGFTADMTKKPTNQPIKNEATAQLKNDRGTIAMARAPDLHSATSQFFINLKDNEVLNHRDETATGFGYAVFGKVIDGMNVVDRIAKVKTTGVKDVPAQPVVIKHVKRVESRTKGGTP